MEWKSSHSGIITPRKTGGQLWVPPNFPSRPATATGRADMCPEARKYWGSSGDCVGAKAHEPADSDLGIEEWTRPSLCRASVQRIDREAGWQVVSLIKQLLLRA